jgi:putative ABC transport system substrate-binding protein
MVEYRFIEGERDRIPTLVNELLQLKVDVLVATSPPTIRAAKQATKTVPIVMVTPQDPVANGMVDSFARPGGNITGVTTLTRDLSGKSLELLKEIIPTLSRVGILAVAGPTVPGNALREYEAAARALKISLQPLLVSSPKPDIEGAFRDAVKNRVSALITARNNVLAPHTKKIAGLAIKTDSLRPWNERVMRRSVGLCHMEPMMVRLSGARHGTSIEFSREPSPSIYPSNSRPNSSLSSI